MPLNQEQKEAFSQQIVANPYFDEVVTLLESYAVDDLVNSKYDDDIARLTAKIKIQVIRDFKSELTKHAKKGN